MVAHLLFVHFQIIFFQYPLEYRENVDLWRAYLLSQGKNPYVYENLPSGSSLYGYIYPWLGAKLLPFTGIAFYPLRLITFIAILPMIAIFIWQGVRQQLESLTLLLISVIVYAIHLIHPGNFVAMPNTLGMTFFCISVLIPPLMRFSIGSLLIASVFSALGFFTKIYFGLGGFYVLLYLFYNKEWRHFGILLTFLLAAMAMVILIIVYKLPAFYELNLESTATIVKWQPKFLWPQIRYFARIFFGFMVLLVAVRWLCPQSKIFSLKNPYFFGLIISSILLIKLGGNEGQFFLYFQHLLLPFIVPLCIEIIKSSKRKGVTITTMLFLNFIYIYSVGIKQIDLESIKNSFQSIEKETAILDPRARVLYNAPLSYYAIKRGVTPNEHGQSGGLSFTHGLGHEQYEIQDSLIKENIHSVKYTEIFVDEWQPAKIYHHDLIGECYYKAKEFEIIMYGQRNKSSLWRPKKSCDKS